MDRSHFQSSSLSLHDLLRQSDAEISADAGLPPHPDFESVGAERSATARTTEWETSEADSAGDVIDKDALIEALTARLEEAAEQLDRFQRSGSREASRRGGIVTELPNDLLESHRVAVEELQQAVQRWDDMNAQATLGRIELQIGELRDLIVQSGTQQRGTHVDPSTSAPHAGHSPHSVSPGPTTPRHEGSPAAEGHRTPTTGEPPLTSKGWWEKQKETLLEGGEIDLDSAPSFQARPGSDGDHTRHADGQTATALDATDIPPLPAPIDFDTVEPGTLRQLVLERDAMIGQLRERLIAAVMVAEFGGSGAPGSPLSLETLSPAMRERWDLIENAWQEKFRRAEMELSLERAKLSRERQQLLLLDEKLKKQLAATADEGTHKGETKSNRRWLRFLRLPGSDAEES